MKSSPKQPAHIVDRAKLPENFPTHRHDSHFCEQLGRTIATFGFLEETLAKAIFSFTATTPYSPDDIEEEYSKWFIKLQKALSDQLYDLTESYKKSVKSNPNVKIDYIDELCEDINQLRQFRNVLCHAFWQAPDKHGRSIPLFVDKKQNVFNTEIDTNYLIQIQKSTVSLACDVIDSVTTMGWQWPGSLSPGKVIF
ncbi:hypothetical protein [Tatumella citrea]|uniref:RiboL-PSP-HEPN domain-containing protein n=1 Tax=Tatumella citrea TaxID=53336 RepID=A0A1Y0LL93_TATCI|nr:hypothetical protein [Tatumella citrea]ARU94401.1 hypothetical protein A7K98_11860 [Tatumella citrea]ARU98440.1 hypothetical protein A7K99_11855 [Tatumella citrea]